MAIFNNEGIEEDVDNKIEEAKAFLKSQGFCSNNLWQIKDVKKNYDCTDEQAFEVLENALHNAGTIEYTYEIINDLCGELNLKKLEEKKNN
jgi:hypothetical protein